jgi:PAS domain S-box-containing protein
MNALLAGLEKFSLNTKLLITFSVGLVIAVVISFYSMVALEANQAEMESLVKRNQLAATLIKENKVSLLVMEGAMMEAVIAQDAITRDRARTQVSSARDNLRMKLYEGQKQSKNVEMQALMQIFQKNFNKFNENVEHVLVMVSEQKQFSVDAARYITSTEFTAALNAADETLIAIGERREHIANDLLESSKRRAERSRTLTLALLGSGLLLSIIISILIGRTIRRPSERLCESVEKLAGGDVSSEIPHTDYPNEIGTMARAISVLKNIYQHANEDHWVKSIASDIGAALQVAEDYQSLAQTALSKLAPAVNAGHGAMFVRDDDDNFTLLASYGYRERKSVPNSFRMGVGLVGQCAMEKNTIMLTSPKDYIRIMSGLGEGPPACIIVLPIIHNGHVLGVLELASFQAFSVRDRALLETLLPSMATTMEILNRNLSTKELLVSTQIQAQRMEQQAAQLEEQTVALEVQQAELKETENWFRSIIETASDGIMVVDEQGRILLSNPAAEELFGYSQDEFRDGGIDHLVPETNRHGHVKKRAVFLQEGRTREMGSGQVINGRHKDGSIFPIRISLKPLPQRGDRGRCVSVTVRRTSA